MRPPSTTRSVSHSPSHASQSQRLLRRVVVPLWALTAVLAVARGLLPGGDGLSARYLEGSGTTTRPVHDAIDRTQAADIIRGRWGGTPPQAFTVIWTGFLTVSAPRTYTFALTSNGASRLMLDDAVAVDNGGPHELATSTGERRLTSGPHSVRLEFTKEAGDVAFDWTWSEEGGPPAPVPSWRLSTVAVRPPLAQASHVVRLLFPAVLVAAFIAFVVAGRAWLRSWRPTWAVALAGPCAHNPDTLVLHRCVRDGLLERLAAWRLPALPSALRRVATIAAVVLPFLLVAHAFAFWGRGVIDQEAMVFVINYLADRPFLKTIFDPTLNDWGLYQARELSYVFDWVDARIFARLMVDWHMLLFLPFSSVLSMVGIVTVYLTGARRVLRLQWTTALLLLALFLSTIVVQSSTAILYRSSKIVLTTLQLFFFYRALWLLEPSRRRVSFADVAGLTIIGVLMSWVDRQGYALMMVVTAVGGFLWVRQRWLPQPSGRIVRAYGHVALAGLFATLWAVAYNNIIAPQAIHRLNGYWPDFVFEEVPLERLDAQLVRDTLSMFTRQVEYFFGHTPFVIVAALAVIVWVVALVHDKQRPASMGVWGWITGTGVVFTTAIVGSSVMLIAVMGMRHPPVFHIADHALWYYTLPFQATVLCATSLALSRLPQGPGARWPAYAALIFIAMVTVNAWHWNAQREFIAQSPQYFGTEHEFSRLYKLQYDLDESGADESARVLPAWMRVRGSVAEVRFPLTDYSFLDAVRASYLTVQRRAPLVDASGPHWKELHEFLKGGASPLLEPGQVADTIRALQAIGIRRLVVRRTDFAAREDAEHLVAAIRALGERVRDVQDDGETAVATLADVRLSRTNDAEWSAVPQSAFTVSASQASDALPGVLDGDPRTEWNSNTRQVGTEWIRVDFKQPHDLTGLRLDITNAELMRYPRGLRVDATTDGGTTTLFDGSALPQILRGVLVDPAKAPLVIPFDARQVRSLVIRQTGDSPSWGWAIAELGIFERPAR